VGRVRLGSLARTRPIDPDYGFSRGTPVDRYYIDLFLTGHAREVRGRVLEIGDDAYTRKFGGERVTKSDVLHVEGSQPGATIVGDLADAPQIDEDAFDCVICVQTLAYVYDVRAAIATLKRVLKPGGTLLVTTAGIAKIGRPESDAWGDYWRLTADSAKRLFEEAGFESVEVTTYGNVLAATAMLHGIAAEEIGAKKLDDRDPDFEVTVAIRARA
jgi:SAM-dependent methyltransferase